MILQLNPMIPVYVPDYKMEGYAFLVINPSQEHHLQFTIAMDNGEIWTLESPKVRFCKNRSVDRINVNLEKQSAFIK